MENRKSVLLLSGGLDSVTLAHYILKHPRLREEEVLALFIDYGQSFVEEEYKRADSCVWGLRFQGYNIKLKRLDVRGQYDLTNVEVPLRNLSFAVIASQQAVNIGADVVYLGVIDANTENPYVDTSPEFFEKLNAVMELFGVYINTPFIEKIKGEVASLARYFDLKREDFWSCNTPIIHENGELETCGECGNCKFYATEFKEAMEIETLNTLWYDGGMDISEKFKRHYVLENVYEARIMVNSSCNMACKHCYYGFANGKTCSPELKLEEWYEIFDRLSEFGIQQFHFSGKEPLLNNRIFKMIDYIKEHHPHIKYEVVTNGKTVEKFREQIINAGFQRVILSFESFDEDFIRENYALQSLKLLQGEVPLATFIDLTTFSYDKLEANIRRLNSELGIRDFWVRPVYYYGGAETITDVLLTPEQTLDAYYLLHDLSYELDVSLTYHLKDSFIETMLQLDNDDKFTFDFEYALKTGDGQIHPNFNFIPQMFCTKYAAQITVQSDGWMLGCGVEVCHSNYDKKSSGNVREQGILELVRAGKERTLELIVGTLGCRVSNGCNVCAGGCTSKNYCYTFQSDTMNPYGEKDHEKDEEEILQLEEINYQKPLIY